MNKGFASLRIFLSRKFLKTALALIWIALAGLANTAQANDNRPLFIAIQQTSAEQYQIRWQLPPSVKASQSPKIILPRCQIEVSALAKELQGAGKPLVSISHKSRSQYKCSYGLNGRESLSDSGVLLEYPTTMTPKLATIVRIAWLSGETQTISASVGELTISVPAPETAAGVAKEYFVLGVEHIWAGYDHLLFIACLVVIAGTLRKMLVTSTGFTLAHSITLVMAALGWVVVPIQAVEATIALSIVFLACELARNNRTTLTWRYPVTVSSSFGLLHGFGFAAVLQEIGLPQTELTTALLAFNLGVEAGQILFVLAVLAGVLLLRQLRTRAKQKEPTMGHNGWQLGFYQLPVGYLVGSLASYWLIERLGFA